MIGKMVKDDRADPKDNAVDAENDRLAGAAPGQASQRALSPGRRRYQAADDGPDLERGTQVIKAQLKSLPASPGVYQMLSGAGEVLYVGKAKSLRNRVTNYAFAAKLPYRLARMVSETRALEVVTCHTEVEALLLESNLIKRHMPRFNVLLRDDKSFPYIHLTGDHEFAQVVKHRGARARPGDYFGPFASAGAVNRTVTALQKAFLLRNCSDAVFAQRTRPCLQYQIKRCAAPCVGRISKEDYAQLVREARAFLAGRSQQIQQDLAERMQQASDALDFETAARYRDRLRAMATVQSQQDVHVSGITDADVLAAHQGGGQTCVQVFFFRGGANYGTRAYFPSHDKQMNAAEVLTAFVTQFYDNKPPPPLVLLSHRLADQTLIGEALSVRAGRKVQVLTPQRGDKRSLIDHALDNAREAHGRRLAESSAQRKLLEGVARVLSLDGTPERIEVYDNSHIQGAKAVGGMIVAGPDGFMKSAYRSFNIKLPERPAAGADEAAVAGDDFAMMREVLTRRFSRALKEDPDRERGTWPDLVLIDGGKGQLGVAQAVFAELGIDDVALVAIAKGPDRDAGRETFYRPDQAPLQLEPRDPVLYFLQRLRDEAHRFAIGSHRARRSRAIAKNPLDEIPGVGAARKRALLHHFGSARAVARAGLADLEKVEGVSKALAKKIYDHFNPGR